MAIAKVIEVLADGDSIEEAMEKAVKEASKTIHNIKGIYAENIQGKVKDNKIVGYRVNAKLTFVIDD